MIDYVVSDLVTQTTQNVRAAAPATIDDVRGQSRRLVEFSAGVADEHLELKQFLRDQVYRHYRVLRMTSKARTVVRELFDALLQDLNLLPPEHRQSAQKLGESLGAAGPARAVADYIAGMTDRYAILEHRRLFEPGERT
jgi:dGTPase